MLKSEESNSAVVVESTLTLSDLYSGKSSTANLGYFSLHNLPTSEYSLGEFECGDRIGSNNKLYQQLYQRYDDIIGYKVRFEAFVIDKEDAGDVSHIHINVYAIDTKEEYDISEAIKASDDVDLKDFEEGVHALSCSNIFAEWPTNITKGKIKNICSEEDYNVIINLMDREVNAQPIINEFWKLLNKYNVNDTAKYALIFELIGTHPLAKTMLLRFARTSYAHKYSDDVHRQWNSSQMENLTIASLGINMEIGRTIILPFSINGLGVSVDTNGTDGTNICYDRLMTRLPIVLKAAEDYDMEVGLIMIDLKRLSRHPDKQLVYLNELQKKGVIVLSLYEWGGGDLIERVHQFKKSIDDKDNAKKEATHRDAAKGERAKLHPHVTAVQDAIVEHANKVITPQIKQGKYTQFFETASNRWEKLVLECEVDEGWKKMIMDNLRENPMDGVVMNTIAKKVFHSIQNKCTAFAGPGLGNNETTVIWGRTSIDEVYESVDTFNVNGKVHPINQHAMAISYLLNEDVGIGFSPEDGDYAVVSVNIARDVMYEELLQLIVLIARKKVERLVIKLSPRLTKYRGVIGAVEYACGKTGTHVHQSWGHGIALSRVADAEEKRNHKQDNSLEHYKPDETDDRVSIDMRATSNLKSMHKTTE